MFNLEMITGKRKTETVVVRGVEVVVRALSAREQAECEDAFTRPKPPLIKDPTKGSNSAAISDHHDPEFVRAFGAYDNKVRAAWVAVATDLDCGGTLAALTGEAERRAWIVRAGEKIVGELSTGEIEGIVKSIATLGRLGDMVSEALKK